MSETILPQKKSKITGIPHPNQGTILLGADVGGTKTRIDLVDENGHRSLLLPSTAWRSNSDTVKPSDMESLAKRLREFILVQDQVVRHPDTCISLCIGLHGADSPHQLDLAERVLRKCLPCMHVRVVNDAELLGPAAGISQALNLVVGTGTVAVGRSVDGTLLRADGYGYGWLLSDFGSAPALIREAVREILHRSILQGEESVLNDVFTRRLLQVLEARDIYQLTIAFGSHAGEKAWGDLAPILFSSLEEGSDIADQTLNQAVERIGQTLSSIVARGAQGNQVVAAGGVITHQPIMVERLRKTLEMSTGGPLSLYLLEDPPALGALRLAKAFIPPGSKGGYW